MRDMFAADPNRFEEFSISLDSLLLDYSKNRINGETMKLLIDLAKEAGLEKARDAMFSGEKSIRRKTAPFCIRLCATVPTARFTLTAKTLCRRSKRFWKK